MYKIAKAEYKKNKNIMQVISMIKCVNDFFEN